MDGGRTIMDNLVQGMRKVRRLLGHHEGYVSILLCRLLRLDRPFKMSRMAQWLRRANQWYEMF